jgi:hypothetical protein
VQPSAISTITISVVAAVLIAAYLIRFRLHTSDHFVPEASWLRAGIYFGACCLVAGATSVFYALLANPIATTKQIADEAWWSWTAGLTLLVTAAYWGIWTCYTQRFDRRLDVILQTAFALLWGASSGLLLLSFYHAA